MIKTCSSGTVMSYLKYMILFFVILILNQANAETGGGSAYNQSNADEWKHRGTITEKQARNFVQSRMLGSWHCPNKCSGHGNCIREHCFCWKGWGYTGIDCSDRLCPYDLAWSGKAHAQDEAHGVAECSNRGKCNTKTGQCRCFAGFEGEACQRSTCTSHGGTYGGSGVLQNICSGNGECLTLDEIYNRHTTTQDVTQSYTAWEGNHTTACVCKNGYSGPSCEYRLCPKGDNPQTHSAHHFTLTVTTASSTGSYVFYFHDQSFTFPGGSQWGISQCAASFQSLPTIEKASCAYSTTYISRSESLYTYTVQLEKFATFPYENNMYTIPENGSPLLPAFACNTAEGSGTCTVAITVTAAGENPTAVPEYATCSSRGICDFTTGTCECFNGYEGSSCGRYTSLLLPSERAIQSTVLDLELTADASTYTANVLNLHSIYGRKERNGFNWINMTNTNTGSDIDKNIFSIDQYGNVSVDYGWMHVKGLPCTGCSKGMTVYNNGIYVQDGGLTVGTGGFIMEKGLVIDRFEVSGGAAQEDGGITVFNAGLSVKDGLTVTNDGMVIYGGMRAYGGGMTLGGGGMNIGVGLTVPSGGVKVLKRGMTINSGGLVVTGGLTLPYSAVPFRPPNGLTIQNLGLYVTGGLTMDVGSGLNIVDGGATVVVGGLRVTNGVSVSSGGLELGSPTNFTDHNGIPYRFVHQTLYSPGMGLTVHSGGMRVKGGWNSEDQELVDLDKSLYLHEGDLTVWDSGLRVQAGGLTVVSDGLVATGGATVNRGGMYIYGLGITSVTRESITINTGNIAVGGGFSADSSGPATHGSPSLAITGGLTIWEEGMNLMSPKFKNQPIKVHNGGLRMYDSPFIGSGGQMESQSLTINTGGFAVEAGSMTVWSGGLSVTGGLTVNTLGLKCGMQKWNAAGEADTLVKSDGMVVTEGAMTVYDVGMNVPVGGIVVKDSLGTTGLRVTGGVWQGGGLYLTGGLTLKDLGLEVDGGVTVKDNGLTVTGGTSVRNGGLSIPNGLTVWNYGLVVVGGLTVESDGMYVDPPYESSRGMVGDEGITVISDGMAAWGGVQVMDGGLMLTSGDLEIHYDDKSTNGHFSVSGGVTVAAPFAVMNGGMTVWDSGLHIGHRPFGGLTIDGGGLVVTGGATVVHGGVRVTGGTSVRDSGMLVKEGGVTVKTAGFYGLTEGITVASGGFVVTGGVNIVSDSLHVTGGITMLTGDVDVHDGMTVLDGGLVVDTGMIRLSNTPGRHHPHLPNDVGLILTIPSGLTVLNDGLTASGGFHVQNNGLAVMGGMTVNGGPIETPVMTAFGGVKSTTGTWETESLILERHNSGSPVDNSLLCNTLGIHSVGGATVHGGWASASGVVVEGGVTIHSGLQSLGYELIEVLGATTGVVADSMTSFYINEWSALDAGSAPISASDGRLKSQVETIQAPVEKLARVRGVYYSWNEHLNVGASDVLTIKSEADTAEGKRRHLGVIAQEIQEVLPEAVRNTGEEDGLLAVAYEEILPLLIEAVKALDSRLRQWHALARTAARTQTATTDTTNSSINNNNSGYGSICGCASSPLAKDRITQLRDSMSRLEEEERGLLSMLDTVRARATVAKII